MQTSVKNEPERADDRTDPPVHLLLRDPVAAEALARDLRQHGYRARSFVNLEVLANAARIQRPAAVMLDLSLLADAQAGRDWLAGLGAAASAPVCVIYVAAESDFNTRLRAVEAGGDAFFPLPVNRASLLHHLRRQADLSASARVARILVLGDARGALAEPIAGLMGLGASVRATEDPEQLLEALAEGACDLLVLGATAGGVDAITIARLVRQTGTHYSLPILVVTDRDKRRLDDDAAGAGIDALVGLPIAPKDLAAIVQAKVSRARGLRAAYAYSARRDPATGLHNFDYFSESLRHAQRDGTPTGALLYLALRCSPDAPRSHETRQRLIACVAEILRPLLPPFAVAALVADDAVAILLPAAEAVQVERIAHQLSDAFRPRELTLGSQAIDLRACVGVTLLGGRRRSRSDALAQAREAAMLNAGENAVPAAGQPPPQDRWLAQIDEALQANRLRLVYQPIASLSGQPTPYYEVFLRMLDAHNGDILPQEFLPAAERGGIAPAIDRWVVNRSLHVLEEQSALHHRPVLFVKLCTGTVGDPQFIGWLRDRLSGTAVEADRLVLQITQRTLITRAAESAALAGELHRLGCLLAIEHYDGGDVLSLELIKSLSPQFLKLSPQITRDIGGSIAHQKQVQAISGLGRSIGARTVAALVQDAINLSVLWRCGVEYIQGYFMQEPVDVFSEETLR